MMSVVVVVRHRIPSTKFSTVSVTYIMYILLKAVKKGQETSKFAILESGRDKITRHSYLMHKEGDMCIILALGALDMPYDPNLASSAFYAIPILSFYIFFYNLEY